MRTTSIPRRRAAWFLARLSVMLLVTAAVLLTQRPAAAQHEPTNATPAKEQATDGPIPDHNLLSIMHKGGLLMWPIAAASFLMLVFAFERAVSLRTGHVCPGPFVKRFLHQLRDGQLDKDQALLLCEENGSSVATVFAAAARKWGKPAVEVEQAMLDAGERVGNGLRRYMRVFNGVSTISPLLGLLGTVVGMIQSFNNLAMAKSLGRPDLLADGISTALLTTAAGLCVAIPALICYLYFVGRVDQLIMRIDAHGQEVVQLISAEGIHEAARGKSPRTPRREAA